MTGAVRALLLPETECDGLRLVPVSAYALLQAQAEADRLAGENRAAAGLCAGACIVARTAHRKDGSRAFSSGEEALRTLSAEAIERLMQAYEQMTQAGRLTGGADEEQALLSAMEQDAQERLRWRVLRAFGVLPTEARARELTQGELVYCAMQLCLDEREELARLCPACRETARTARCVCCGAPLPEENAAFDEKRYEELKRDGVHRESAAAAHGAGGGD